MAPKFCTGNIAFPHMPVIYKMEKINGFENHIFDGNYIL
jgi:hypothetical protein